MSKIISHGKQAGKDRAWWNGRQTSCRQCRCTFEITPDTPLKIGQYSNSSYYATPTCPECGLCGDFQRSIR